MPAEIQLRSNLCWERSGGVRESWTMKARMDLFCDRSTSNRFAAFQHKRFQPRLCKIAGGDEAVVSSSDDNDVVHSVGFKFQVSGFRCRFRSFQFRLQVRES